MTFPACLTSGESNPIGGFMTMSSIEDLSYTPSPEERKRDAVQTIVTGRRSWKTLRGKGEAVWPPQLEAALIEALERYRPGKSSSNTKLLGRFPRRNKFISEYIFRTTGKHRTAKQVGSRLQQLRDTCGGRRILSLVADRRLYSKCNADDWSSNAEETQAKSTVPKKNRTRRTLPECPTTDSPPQGDTLAEPAQPPHLTLDYYFRQDQTVRTSVCVSVLREDHSKFRQTGSEFSSRLDFKENISLWNLNTQDISNGFVGLSHNSTNIPRPLSEIDPTVTFKSPTPLSAGQHSSAFTVLFEGRCVHKEVSELTFHPCADRVTATDVGRYLYSTKLAPKYWRDLCVAEDLTRYIVVQDIVRSATSPSGRPLVVPHSLCKFLDNQIILSVEYRFQYASPPSPSSSFTTAASPLYSPMSPVQMLDAVKLPLLASILTSQPPNESVCSRHNAVSSLDYDLAPAGWHEQTLTSYSGNAVSEQLQEAPRSVPVHDCFLPAPYISPTHAPPITGLDHEQAQWQSSCFPLELANYIS